MRNINTIVSFPYILALMEYAKNTSNGSLFMQRMCVYKYFQVIFRHLTFVWALWKMWYNVCEAENPWKNKFQKLITSPSHHYQTIFSGHAIIKLKLNSRRRRKWGCYTREGMKRAVQRAALYRQLTVHQKTHRLGSVVQVTCSWFMSDSLLLEAQRKTFPQNA